MVPPSAMVLAMKEIYGWLLIGAILFIMIVAVSYGPLRPFAIFPKWKTIRRSVKQFVKPLLRRELPR
jgi:MFS transporter, DHA2 family, multidrug resistance protein